MIKDDAYRIAKEIQASVDLIDIGRKDCLLRTKIEFNSTSTEKFVQVFITIPYTEKV